MAQNAGHILAVKHVLKLPPGRCHNVVFLGGDAEFKTAPIPGVVTRKLANHIKKFQTPLIAAAACPGLAARLREASYSHDRASRRAHRAYVKGFQRKS